MNPLDLQSLCEQGSQALVSTDYIAAERLLVQAETLAIQSHDFDTLSRLYFPLQEARRQIRHRCGEGLIQLDFIATSPTTLPNPVEIADRHPKGQFLIAGWMTTAPAESFRALARERNLYAETFLALAIPLPSGQTLTAITPKPFTLHTPPTSPDHLASLLPPHSIISPSSPPVPPTYAGTMSLWEQLHLPFLALADALPNSLAKLSAYHQTLEVDYACELAHQNAAKVARELARELARQNARTVR